MSILLKALDQIDIRLVNHGRRVAYIIMKMMQADGSYSPKHMHEITILAALHDIGAYAKDEIDQMMLFESDSVYDHSINGYLFFKYMSPLEEWADAILYHHMDYESYPPGHAGEHRDVAAMIYLADRMDILFRNGEPWLDTEEIREQQAIRFGNTAVELFWEADKKFRIGEKLRNGTYMDELAAFLSTEDYSEDMLLDYIRMIAYTIDFRSEFTASHTITTASISLELGKLLGMDEEELKKIQLGAYLHDIGKIATPPEILGKKGALTSEEMRIMRKHVETTGKIIKGCTDEDVFRIAFRHHEKMDGSGYPEQLRAEQLTMSDRIVAVADQISALVGKRSYKESFPKEKVLEILRQQMDGGKLCGSVTEQAIRHYDAILETSKKNIGVIAEQYNRFSEEFKKLKMSFGH